MFGSKDICLQKMYKILTSNVLASKINSCIFKRTHWILLIFCMTFNDNNYSKVTGPNFFFFFFLKKKKKTLLLGPRMTHLKHKEATFGKKL